MLASASYKRLSRDKWQWQALCMNRQPKNMQLSAKSPVELHCWLLLRVACCCYVLWQMEGANLYDVFQKIGRGDFQPLPADRFSHAMRGAVQQLLAQDPNTRPSAEQCYQQVLLVQQQLAQLQAAPGQQLQQQAGQQQRPLQQTGSAKQRQVITRMRKRVKY
jgi:hypothetical protein